jgi:hypothetical protein
MNKIKNNSYFIACTLLTVYFIFVIYKIYYKEKCEEQFSDLNKVITDNSFNNFGNNIILPLLNDPKWTKYVDKLKFKEVCHINNIKTFKTIRILKEPNELYNLQMNLPNNFIIKSNKGSGRNFIVKNVKSMYKNDYKKTIDTALEKLSNWADPYWNIDREPQYEYTTPKMFIEEFIDPIPFDIKVILYNKKPTIIWIDDGRFSDNHKRYFYKIDNDTISPIEDCVWTYKHGGKFDFVENLIKNNRIKDLINKSTKFDIDIPLVRVDFYWHNNDFYGGEVTFTSGSFDSNIKESCAKIALDN